jgi:NO-binding membrane sensor protein with MHYT domain
VLINYDSVETSLSIAAAIGGTAAGLSVVSNRRFGAFSIPGAALLMGLGIASMHYLAMNAIRGCSVTYDASLVAASVAIAITASMAACGLRSTGGQSSQLWREASCRDWPLPPCTIPR